MSDFVKAWDELATIVHKDNVTKGFWPDGLARNRGEIIALIHSELSEALEAERDGNPPDPKVPTYGAVEVELGDAVIRIMDYAKAFNLDVGSAILAKLEYNRSRPHKHGRKF